MKRFIWLAVIILTTSTTFAQKSKKFEKVKILTSAVCDMCKTTMEKNLVFEKGIREVTLDVETKILTVEYRPDKTDTDKIKKAINKLGYDADDAMATKEQYEKLHSCCRKDSH